MKNPVNTPKIKSLWYLILLAVMIVFTIISLIVPSSSNKKNENIKNETISTTSTAKDKEEVQGIVANEKPEVHFHALGREMEIGESVYVKYTVTASTEDMVRFWSEDVSIVTVDENGKLEAIGEGTTLIYAYIQGHLNETKETYFVVVMN